MFATIYIRLRTAEFMVNHLADYVVEYGLTKEEFTENFALYYDTLNLLDWFPSARARHVANVIYLKARGEYYDGH